MVQPVVHFEIIGTGPQRLRSYYGELFGWEFDTSNVVADAVSEPTNYGFVQQETSGGGIGIPGGVGGGTGYDPRAMFYVSVPDVGDALQQADKLGGTRTMGPAQAPQGSSSATSPIQKATWSDSPRYQSRSDSRPAAPWLWPGP
jgi:predicted enzyme related to lactoylglutathione lyase